jgi:hypothetical protein
LICDTVGRFVLDRLGRQYFVDRGEWELPAPWWSSSGCGTESSMSMRQNRCQEIESATSARRVS